VPPICAAIAEGVQEVPALTVTRIVGAKPAAGAAGERAVLRQHRLAVAPTKAANFGRAGRCRAGQEWTQKRT
jgi:hypothetical protein